ncbi:MAG: pilin, partial [Gammaproteobacteria bacterium]
YVKSVQVIDGTGHIVITYDNLNIGGGMTGTTNVLELTPGTGGGMAGGVIWACGLTKVTAGGETADGTGGVTTVANKFLPANCRG